MITYEMIATPAIGMGLVMQAMIVAKNRANICHPATVIVAGFKGVNSQSTIPTTKGKIKPL
ncbi:hypothetical protein LCB40_07440 [Lactobacillus corticis]|uniref:Uncharacterized protein n=1 Tax=Lactobacillus corticis TaxID=2201249 RepID=A0A916VJ23_9LACO|nr:hypothetical protein LCB40_07440 [Lactobacillus corticis]